MSRHNYSCALASSCHRPDQYHPREEGGVRKGVRERGRKREREGEGEGGRGEREREREREKERERERERGGRERGGGGERERERGHDVYKITIYMDVYYSFYSAVLHK